MKFRVELITKHSHRATIEAQSEELAVEILQDRVFYQDGRYDEFILGPDANVEVWEDSK